MPREAEVAPDSRERPAQSSERHGIGSSTTETPTRRAFTFAEVFAGIGGFRVGLEAAGGRCVFASEYCHFAQATYRANWPASGASMVAGDVGRVAAAQVPAHDLLAAGFPCQSFSNAGRLGRLDDDRGQLFYELLRLIRGCKPRALLLENVRGLLTHTETLQTILSLLADAGYPDVQVHELDAASLVPQRRRRIFFVGFRDAGARHAFRWPHLPELRRVADDVLQHAIGCAVPPSASGLTLPAHKWRRVEECAYYRRFPGSRLLQPGAVAQTLQATYKSGYLLYSQFVPTAEMALPSADEADQPTDAEVEAAADCEPSPRFFSPRECARLMGFPEAFVLPSGDGLAHRQLGNAVCPPLVGALGVAIARALEATTEGGGAGSDEEREAATQCAATAISLELALASCVPDRRPSLCWLHRDALSALACADDTLRLSAAEAAVIASDTECRVRGADYHAPCEAEWVGPLSLTSVLQRARQRAGRMAPCHAEGYALPLDRSSPEQTLPAATSAIKAQVAAPCMRQYLMARHITSVAACTV